MTDSDDPKRTGEVRTVEDVLSERFGYPVDPVKMEMERRRRLAEMSEPQRSGPTFGD